MAVLIQALSSVASTVPPKDAIRAASFMRRGALRRSGPHSDEEPEFRVYAKCLGEAPCLESGETASTCLMEEDEYSECTCKAELGDPTTCKWL